MKKKELKYAMPALSQKTKGILYVVVAAFGFSMMSLFVKLSGDLPAFQKAFFRNFIALLFILAMMRREKIPFRPEKGNIPALFGRCFCGTVGLLCNFYAIGQLNLSDANMLNKLSPFFAILFSVFLLKEKPSWVQVLGVLVAFAGSVCIIKPSFRNPAAFPAFAGAIGGMGAGAAYTFVRKLGRAAGEQQAHRVLFFCVFLFGLPAVFDLFVPAHDRLPAHLPDSRGHVRLRGAAGHHQSLPLRACQGDLGL